MNKMKFVVGANPELGGKNIRLMALSENNTITQLDYSDILLMPSAFAYDRRRGILYVTDELNDGLGKLAVFSVLDNKLKLLQIIATQGSNPCHVSLDLMKNLVFVSHYSGGGVICFKVLKSGLINSTPLLIMEKSKSFHCVLPLNNGIIALDSIDDELIHTTYSSEELNYDSITIKINSPRQAKRFDKNRVLIVSENESMLYIYDLEMKKVVLSTHACVGVKNTNRTASMWLSPNKKNILVSNRGEDSLVAFDVEKSNYIILKNPRALLQGGYRCPRDFDIDYSERYAVIGFMESNRVAVYRMNKNISKADCVATIELTAPIGMQIL